MRDKITRVFRYKKIKAPLALIGAFIRLRWRLCLALLAGVLVGFFLWTVLAPQTVRPSLSQQEACVASPRFFTSDTQITGSQTFKTTRPASISVGSWTIFARTVCVTPQQAPKSNVSYVYTERSLGIFKRTITVKAPRHAGVVGYKNLQKIPPKEPLQFELTAPDNMFDYAVKLDGPSVPCKVDRTKLACDVAALGLAYAKQYDISVVRSFKNKAVETVRKAAIQTITPTVITSSSIVADAVVQDKPQEFTVQTDKPLADIGTAQLVSKDGTAEALVPTETTFTGQTIRMRILQELPRKKNFEFRLASVEAKDRSGLEQTSFALPFQTSGGPRVLSTGLGAKNASLQPTAVLRFDQPLLATQNVAPHIVFKVNGQPVETTLAIAGDRVTLRPVSPLPLCAKISLSVSNAIQSQHGISGDSAWTSSSRAICYTSFSLGSSVRGRSLTAYRFGTGPEQILYLGAMHGSEQNTKRLMDEWFNEINANPDRIPAHRSVVIVSAVNPDGYAAAGRLNANNVDINRNFPANDWKQSVTLPGSSTPVDAGGPNPLSEPESQAVANYIRSTQPRLVMSFHSRAAVVEANEAGDSVGIAAGYASRASYRAIPRSQNSPTFLHDTTGAMEDWMRDKLGRPAIVVELSTHTSSEFSRNRSALWYSLQF